MLLTLLGDVKKRVCLGSTSTYFQPDFSHLLGTNCICRGSLPFATHSCYNCFRFTFASNRLLNDIESTVLESG